MHPWLKLWIRADKGRQVFFGVFLGHNFDAHPHGNGHPAIVGFSTNKGPPFQSKGLEPQFPRSLMGIS